jgi:hypothetical protein
MEWSERSEVVKNSRLTVARLRDTELVGIDWVLPSSIRLTGRTRGPWRSFEAACRGLGMPAAVGLEIAGARVSVTYKNSREREKGCGSRVFLGGGSYLKDDGGRWRSSGASTASGRSSGLVLTAELLQARGRRRSKGYAGQWLLGHDGWAATARLGQVSFLLYFFLQSVLSYFLFCLSNLSFNLFCRIFNSELHIRYKDDITGPKEVTRLILYVHLHI